MCVWGGGGGGGRHKSMRGEIGGEEINSITLSLTTSKNYGGVNSHANHRSSQNHLNLNLKSQGPPLVTGTSKLVFYFSLAVK